jgi:hypothetical protein
MSVSTVSSAADNCARPLSRRVSQTCSGYSRNAMNMAHSSGPKNGSTILNSAMPRTRAVTSAKVRA